MGKRLSVGLASLILYHGCVPSSEAGRTCTNIGDLIDFPYPNYPPYVPEEPVEDRGCYPVRVIEWDDTENAKNLLESDGHATIKGMKSYNSGVVNGVIVEFGHEIKERYDDSHINDRKDLFVGILGDHYGTVGDEPVNIGIYLVERGQAFFKQRGKTIRGWNAYVFYPIEEYGGFFTGDGLWGDVGEAIEEAGGSTRFIGVMNYSNKPLEIKYIKNCID